MDPGDLEYNRRGLLGPGQRARLEALCASYGSVSISFALGPAADTARAFHAQLCRELQDGRVMASTGKVESDFRAFHSGMAEGRKYDLPGNHESIYCAALDEGGNVKVAHWLDLLPGRYELYVATWAGLVVGASPLQPFDHTRSFFRALCEAQGLAAETLEENRRGRMTDAQQSALRSADDAPLGYGCAFFAFGTLLACGQLGRFFGLLWGRKDSTLSIVATLFVIVCGVIALVHDLRHRRAMRRNAEEGRVAMTDGPLRKRFSIGSKGSVSRKLEIGAHTFDITDRAELYATLIPGFAYRVYFLPGFDKLLVIELLPQEGTIAVAPF